ncbi:MAG: DNA gyrase subunit B [Verrucomicrobia subdivision 3 bacterium]|nr:DNA gyrase subunit B [Limisphaerales bacterium]MCS1417767.1 DNA gyrase subunit B [Limisphaerales bacterium]
MDKAPEHKYDESKIKTLSSLEHIRLRTGMYIGRIGDGTHYDDGCYILLKEVIDNAIDEYIMGFGKEVRITIEEGAVMVRDFGRGIPLGKIVDCVSTINTGAKYNDDVFQFSVGLNGVGAKAVNALSEQFVVRSVRKGCYAQASFERGTLKKATKGSCKNEPNGTLVRFVPDPHIFKNIVFRDDLIDRRLKHCVYLNSGLRLTYNGKKYYSRKGLLDLIGEEIGDQAAYPPVYFATKTLEFSFTHSNSRSGEIFYSFVNGQYTSEGGTHLSAFREGLLKAVNEYTKGKYDGDDVRESMVGAISIRLQEPVFESQTKNKLGNTEIRSDLVTQVREEVLHYLHRNKEAAQQIAAKVEDTKLLRKELQAVKRIARERAKSVRIRIPQLKDCKVHLDKRKGKGLGSMVFITEGVSAAGSIVSCRDVNTQAIFTLKGKPLNVWDLKRDVMYKNDEMYNLMCTLGVEDSLDNLRYNKVILATDADVDGLHIRNLMITYFFRFFDQLVYEGHLHVLETPLFRVRNKKKTIYCYSEAERARAEKEICKGREITRFKGLGEISPKEFQNFIGNEMRLGKVEYAARCDAAGIFDFYMGRNTLDRKAYILKNLVVSKED